MFNAHPAFPVKGGRDGLFCILGIMTKVFTFVVAMLTVATMFAGTELFDPAQASINSTYFAPNWTADGVSSATYDAATGKFSAGDVSSYMFNAKKNGKEVSVIASEEMTCSQEKPALLAEWKSSSLTFKFTSDDNGDNATVTQQDGSYPEFTVPYTNDGGWITVSNFPLFFSSSNRMFYLAYVTERTEVEAVGRNASCDELNFVSPVFILADIQL